MKRKTAKFSLVTILAATIVVALVGAVVPPQEVEAIGGCRCVGPISYTQVVQSDEATCSLATSVLHQTLENMTGCGGQFCVNQLIITMPCTFNPEGTGSWWVAGKLKYQCEICLPGGP